MKKTQKTPKHEIEKCANSPQLSTLMKLLYPMGYTLKVVPIEEAKK